MALQGTFAEPIEPFIGYSESVSRMHCREITSINDMVQSGQASTDYHNSIAGGRGNGRAKPPLSGSNWYSHSGLTVFGYNKESLLEFYFGSKAIKFTWDIQMNTIWHQMLIGDRFPNHYAKDELLNPNTQLMPQSSTGSKTYSSLRGENYSVVPNDWIIPKERVCGNVQNHFWQLPMSFEQWDNLNLGSQGNVYYFHNSNTPLAGFINRIEQDNYGLTLSTQPQFFIGARGQTTPTVAPFNFLSSYSVSQFWSSAFYTHSKGNWRFIDSNANLDITGECWLASSHGMEDFTLNVNSFNCTIEILYWDFEKRITE